MHTTAGVLRPRSMPAMYCTALLSANMQPCVPPPPFPNPLYHPASLAPHPPSLQGGYLERHKRHKPNSQSLGALNPGLLGSETVNPGGALGLGNFTDAIHTNLDLLTLSNVAPGSPRMWLHLVSVYLVTLGALKVCGGGGMGEGISSRIKLTSY
jgi:hypothetical protein